MVCLSTNLRILVAETVWFRVSVVPPRTCGSLLSLVVRQSFAAADTDPHTSPPRTDTSTRGAGVRGSRQCPDPDSDDTGPRRSVSWDLGLRLRVSYEWVRSPYLRWATRSNTTPTTLHVGGEEVRPTKERRSPSTPVPSARGRRKHVKRSLLSPQGEENVGHK